MADKSKGTDVYGKLLIEQASQLDPNGDLASLAKDIVQEQTGAGLLLFLRRLSLIDAGQNEELQSRIKSVKSSLLQFCGYCRVIELCREATNQEDVQSEPTLEECLDELNRLVGLESVKHEINGLIAYQRVQKRRIEAGLSAPQRTLHLAFTGRPGTGKTTVARIVGRIYKHLGLLSKGHFIEASRTDLIAGYQGQTAIKVKKLIEKAKGGVLFIDEAYSITENEHSDSYGRECVTELTKALEDYRKDLVVIVAGYTKPMEHFFSSNPGLKSRFNTFIEFEDYNEEELLLILKKMCSSDDYMLSLETIELLKRHIGEVLKNKPEDFSNGRYIRNIYENAITQHARRLSGVVNPSSQDLQVIYPRDIVINKVNL